MGFILSLLIIALFAVLFLVGIGMYLLSSFMGGLSNAMKFVRRLFGIDTKKSSANKGPKAEAYGNGYDGEESTSYSDSGGGDAGSRGNRGKVFDRNEGVYVDFEEIN